MRSKHLIKEARLRAGLTQAELAERTDNSQSEIARWERGSVTPSFETLQRLVVACDLDLSVGLFRRDDSDLSLIEQNLAMTPAERFAHARQRTSFKAGLERLRDIG